MDIAFHHSWWWMWTKRPQVWAGMPEKTRMVLLEGTADNEPFIDCLSCASCDWGAWEENDACKFHSQPSWVLFYFSAAWRSSRCKLQSAFFLAFKLVLLLSLFFSSSLVYVLNFSYLEVIWYYLKFNNINKDHRLLITLSHLDQTLSTFSLLILYTKSYKGNYGWGS